MATFLEPLWPHTLRLRFPLPCSLFNIYSNLTTTVQHGRGEYETPTVFLLNKLAAKLASDQLTSHHIGWAGSSGPWGWSCPQALGHRFRFLSAAFLWLLSSLNTLKITLWSMEDLCSTKRHLPLGRSGSYSDENDWKTRVSNRSELVCTLNLFLAWLKGNGCATLWSRLKYCHNYYMNYHEIWYRNSWWPDDDPSWLSWSPDVCNRATSMSKF